MTLGITLPPQKELYEYLFRVIAVLNGYAIVKKNIGVRRRGRHLGGLSRKRLCACVIILRAALMLRNLNIVLINISYFYLFTLY
jgi:hypothetical protein